MARLPSQSSKDKIWFCVIKMTGECWKITAMMENGRPRLRSIKTELSPTPYSAFPVATEL